MKKKSLGLLFIVLAGCSSLKGDPKRISSQQISTDLPSPLKEETKPLKDSQIALIDGHKAFTARLYLVNEAKHSLDLQYYIWHDDGTGKELLKAILLAADRGVRVRLLLDNLNESKFHKVFAMLEKHPQIEVRLVNPELQHFNHRMHNKSLIADNQAAIVGGRNIGDEYFRASEEMNFGDFDLLLLGKSVPDVSQEFDKYWNNDRSFPVTEVFKWDFSKEEYKEADKALKKIQIPVVESPFKDKIYHGESEVVCDSPAKLSGKKKENLLINLKSYLEETDKELILVSPYFIPGEAGVKSLSKLVKRGVRVIVITNSLASNDVSTVFGGYKKYRKDLLEHGIELYEVKSKQQKFSDEENHGSTGSTGLHGKVMIIDQDTMFVGSMNLDPRSVDINTEMGVVLKKSEMARDVSKQLHKGLDKIAYKLKLTGDNIRWLETKNGEYVTHKEEPDTTWWMRTKTWFSSIFIPESLL